MADYFIHDGVHILRTVTCPAGLIEIQCQQGEFWGIGDVEGRTHYVVDGLPVLRMPMPCSIDKISVMADETDEATIYGIPAGGVVMVNRESIPVETGELALVFDTPGDYPVRVSAFPFLDWEVTIHAT